MVVTGQLFHIIAKGCFCQQFKVGKKISLGSGNEKGWSTSIINLAI
jgi:hypothetical protein